MSADREIARSAKIAKIAETENQKPLKHGGAEEAEEIGIAEIAVIGRNATPAGQERPDLVAPVIAVIGKAKPYH